MYCLKNIFIALSSHTALILTFNMCLFLDEACCWAEKLLTDINLPLLNLQNGKNNFGGSNLFWILENDDVTCNPRIMPKIPEISVRIQIERSVSVSSERNWIFRIISRGGPLILVGIFQPKFAIPVLTNQFFALRDWSLFMWEGLGGIFSILACKKKRDPPL